jgi:hypothetical protein
MVLVEYTAAGPQRGLTSPICCWGCVCHYSKQGIHAATTAPPPLPLDQLSVSEAGAGVITTRFINGFKALPVSCSPCTRAPEQTAARLLEPGVRSARQPGVRRRQSLDDGSRVEYCSWSLEYGM